MVVLAVLIGIVATPRSHADNGLDLLPDAQGLTSHHARVSPEPSSLPPPRLIGDAATRLTRRYGGTPVDVTTFHYHSNRTGWNATETDLTPATVASDKFGLLATLKVDGNVLAQPLLVSAFTFANQGTHDVLIIATGHNSVYAFDAQTYALLWNVNLGTPQSSHSVACSDVQPEYGITGTPVIVRTAANSATLYVVAATEPSAGRFVHQLHALDLANGNDLVPPAVISPSATLSDGTTVTFDPRNQETRPGLAYDNGFVYVAVGSRCDKRAGSISGWLLRYGSQLKLLQAFHTVETNGGTELASIWMTGFAPAIDPSGNVYVVTGNGEYAQTRQDWGESVLRFGPQSMTVESYFTPATYATLNTNDEDFGSGGVMLLPPIAGQVAPPLAVAMGKSSILYLLNQQSLGGLKAKDAGALQAQFDGGRGLYGGPAYYDGPSGPTVFTQSGSDVLRAWSLATGASPSLTRGATGTSLAGAGGSMPIVSSNGAAAGTGVVWVIDRRQEPFSLQAYDAVRLSAPIFSAQVGTWSTADHGNPFLTAMEANGRVYAPGYLLVRVYGLTP